MNVSAICVVKQLRMNVHVKFCAFLSSSRKVWSSVINAEINVY